MRDSLLEGKDKSLSESASPAPSGDVSGVFVLGEPEVETSCANCEIWKKKITALQKRIFLLRRKRN